MRITLSQPGECIDSFSDDEHSYQSERSTSESREEIWEDRISERAIALMLTFIRLLLGYIAIISQSPVLIHLSSIIPKSLRKHIRNKRNGLCEFVVCSKCHALYEPSQCVVKEHGVEMSKHCDYIEFPQHPHSSRRTKCGTPLMKRVRLGGKSKLVPYIYHSVIAGIEKLMQNKQYGLRQFVEKA